MENENPLNGTILDLKMESGANAVLSFQMNLIMLHSPDISAQWEPDHVGVQVFNYGERAKIGFTLMSDLDPDMHTNYQSFLFDGDYYPLICQFFKKLNFPDQCFYNVIKD